jgi:hypothetical protein
MKNYPIEDEDIKKFIKTNSELVAKPGVDDIRAGIGHAHKGYKKITSTTLGIILLIIVILVSIFFFVLTLMGLLSMEMLDYVKFIIVVLMIFGIGAIIYLV